MFAQNPSSFVTFTQPWDPIFPHNTETVSPLVTEAGAPPPGAHASPLSLPLSYSLALESGGAKKPQLSLSLPPQVRQFSGEVKGDQIASLTASP